MGLGIWCGFGLVLLVLCFITIAGVYISVGRWFNSVVMLVLFVMSICCMICRFGSLLVF